MTGSVAVSVTSLCSPVNGVAVLRHQTPNLHCCIPDYDAAIMDGVNSVQSQRVESISPMQ